MYSGATPCVGAVTIRARGLERTAARSRSAPVRDDGGADHGDAAQRDGDDHAVGLETMCVAGGQGEAMIVERLN
jgi:hypothetical protein